VQVAATEIQQVIPAHPDPGLSRFWRVGTLQTYCPAAVSSVEADPMNGEPKNPTGAAPAVSIVVPVRNEADNVGPLTDEIARALDGRFVYEIIYVNDGSTDGTTEKLRAEMARRSNLRQIRHAASCGQSAAVRSGVRAARGALVATLDGDGQNDPSFLPALIDALGDSNSRIGLVAGQRVGRKDTGFKKFQSRIANAVRGAVLRDGTRDTGCGLKAFRREAFLALPYFDGLHRFLPALMRREGYEIAYVDVVDRPRRAGVSNYGLFDRLWVGIMDLCGVWWLIRRKRATPVVTEIEA
jgi:glycosyltransferase involved in cell wall biosynthesis